MPGPTLSLVADEHSHPDDLDGHHAKHRDPEFDTARLVLVGSVEPGVVFSSLAARCVPDVCDDCVIDLVDGTLAGYRIVYPSPESVTGGVKRIATQASATPDQCVRVTFARPRSEHDPEPGRPEPGQDDFHGVATFAWRHRMPLRADRTAVAAQIDHAVHTVMWHRSDAAAHVAAAHASNLRLALERSRDIGTAVGIVMSLHKITRDSAFELLRLTSQQHNRKVRDLASDVIDTGCLELDAGGVHHIPRRDSDPVSVPPFSGDQHE